MTVTVVDGNFEHVPALAYAMRQSDRDEARALGISPTQGLIACVQDSALCWTGCVDCEPVCMFGVVPIGGLLSGKGEPWLLATDGIKGHQMTFLRLNRFYIPIMLRGFPRLESYVHDANKVSIRWLRWLGFRFAAPAPLGPRGELFRHFLMEA